MFNKSKTRTDDTAVIDHDGADHPPAPGRLRGGLRRGA